MLDQLLGESPLARRAQSLAARVLHRCGVSANLATALAAASGVGAGGAFFAGRLGLGLVLLAISAGLDAIDGTMAREFGGATPLGGVFDLTADRVVETAVIVGIAWHMPELWRPALLLVASWYVNITIFLAVGAALERRGPKIIDYPPGILERTEALIFFAVLAIVASFTWLNPAGPVLCYLMTALELVTGAQRLIFGRGQLLKAAP